MRIIINKKGDKRESSPRMEFIFIKDIGKGEFTSDYDESQDLNYYAIDYVVKVYRKYIEALYSDKDVDIEAYITHKNNNNYYKTIITMYDGVVSVIPLFDSKLIRNISFIERRRHALSCSMSAQRNGILGHLYRSEKDSNEMTSIMCDLKKAEEELHNFITNAYKKAVKKGMIKDSNVETYLKREFDLV